MTPKTYWFLMFALMPVLMGLYALFARLFEDATPFARTLILGLPLSYAIFGGWLQLRVKWNDDKKHAK